MTASEPQPELRLIADRPPAVQPILLGALLSREFMQRGVLLTVVGGAAVQFYTQAEYITHDLDAILIGDSVADVDAVMSSLGFKRTTTYRHFEHPLLKFVVEFPSPPIEVASRHIGNLVNLQTELGPVRILRVEDVIIDRIVAGVEWHSPDRLAQARLLWLKNRRRHLDLKYLKQFAREEGYLKELNEVMKGPAQPRPRQRGLRQR